MQAQLKIVVGEFLQITAGPQAGKWMCIKEDGCGSRGTSSHWVRIGKKGRPLTSPGNGMNLTTEQVMRAKNYGT